MIAENIKTVTAVFGAFISGDRNAIEPLIADDFHFTSPLDNRLDRKTYFERCWPNHQRVRDFKFIHLVPDGERVFATYEGQSTDGAIFRNTEILTVGNGKLIEAEVYFGWNLPHKAPPGGFLD